MEDQPDPTPEDASASEPAAEKTGASNDRERPGKTLGLLRSWTFWWRLGVGVLILGAGVLVGLGIDRLVDEDRRYREDGSRRSDVITFEVKPSGERFGERRGPKDGRRYRLDPIPGRGWGWAENGRGWRGKEWSEERGLPEGRFEDRRGIYIPYELLEELIERAADRMERLLDRIESSLEEGRFPPGMMWPDRFDDGSGNRGLGRDYWEDKEFPGDGDYFQDERKQKYQDHFPADGEDEESWSRNRERPFEGFGIPFGEFLPGLAFLEDCELDLEDFFGMMENLEGLDGEGLEEGEDGLRGLFEEVEEFFAEACGITVDN